MENVVQVCLRIDSEPNGPTPRHRLATGVETISRRGGLGSNPTVETMAAVVLGVVVVVVVVMRIFDQEKKNCACRRAKLSRGCLHIQRLRNVDRRRM